MEAAKAWSLRLRAQALEALNGLARARPDCANWPTSSCAGALNRRNDGCTNCSRACHRRPTCGASIAASCRSWPTNCAGSCSSRCRGPAATCLEPRHGRADHRAALRVRHAATTASCGTSATRPTRTRSSPAGARRWRTLRQYGGISGFPRREECEYDTFGTAHSSTSISAALGMARGRAQPGRSATSIAVIGDGAMTAGMAFEAMNNAGVTRTSDLLVILNDNDMSISPAVGALNRYLARLMTGQFYAAAKHVGKQRADGSRPCSRWRASSRSTPRAWWCRARCSRSSASTTSARSTATTSTR